MANKTYSIQINGLQESIKAVDALTASLESLEKKIKALEGKAVNIGSKVSSGGGEKSSSKAALSEEEKLERQIAQIDEKRVAYSKEVYQNYLAAKDVLKETVKDQQSIAATERLQAKTYSNTIAGMKQELADIKSAMQTVDLGDTDQLDKMTQRANELNEALKKIEYSYGQFGRNVGNYASAANGFKGLRIEIAGTIQEFDNAKQAAKTLQAELTTLQYKQDKGLLLSDDELKRFKELPSIVAQLKSSIQDAGKPMDTLMDTMQSFVAIAQTTKGLSAFLGLDDDKIERSIQKLVALQNAMQGIQNIQKQIKSGEFLGGFLTKASAAIDAFAAKITKTEKAAKGLSLALKTISGLALVGAIIAITKALSDLNKKQKDVEKSAEEGLKVYARTETEISALQTKLNNFNGTKEQEDKLVKSLNSKYGNSIGQYKSLAAWKDALIKKGKVYCQILQKEAEMQAIMNLYTENFIKLQKARKAQEEGNQDTVDLILKALDGEVSIRRVLASIRDDFKAPFTDNLSEYNNELEREVDELEKNGKELKDAADKIQEDINKLSSESELMDYAPQIEKNSKKSANAAEKAEKELTNLELRMMRDGLGKKLRELDEEERQTINKLKENGRKSANEIEKVQRLYAAKRRNEIQEYLRKLEEDVKQSAKNIENVQFDINISKFKNSIDEIENDIKQLSIDQPIRNTLVSETEIKGIKSSYKVDDSKLDFAKTYNRLFNESEVTNKADEFYKFLTEYIKDKNKELYQDIADYNDAIYNETDEEKKKVYIEGAENTYKKVSNIIEEEYANELLYIRDYTEKADQTLSDSLNFRLKSEEAYNDAVRAAITKNLQERAELNKQLIEEEISATTESERERYRIQMSGLTAQKAAAEEAMSAIAKAYNISSVEGTALIKETNKEAYEEFRTAQANIVELEAQIETAKKQHEEKLLQITKEGNNKIKNNEIESANAIASEQEKLFDNQINNIRDAQSKINELLSKQPVMNKFGIVDVNATKKQYQEIVDATKKMTNEIIVQKAKLNALWASGLIKPEAMNTIKQQLNDLEQAFKQLFQQIETEQKDMIPKFVQSCQVYIQGAFDSYNQIMNAVWDAQDAAFDKEQEQLDDEKDYLQNVLDEKKEMISKYKSSIDSIEDELANSRGDRRQHLIDQLNAEMAAEREAAKQKKKIEEDQEKQKAKQDKLDQKRKIAEYHRNIAQAIVNGAMAVTMAAVNSWPIPAIPMMALAGASTAAQIAIMAANKPYRVGGQLEGGLVRGKRHTQGGVPVGNTGIEVEGDEMIIRRESTLPNIDLLNYINKSQKKIDLDDMIDFYSSGKFKKHISSISPKTKFADGGQITLPNTIDVFDNKVLSAIDAYSNRPIYVTVTDIENRMEQVRYVRTLAGVGQE